ncbi:hypothetical protein BLNAU_20321 [Blattamonas nauphoetae]|uniref:Uncharacterized protein n=1 Tax=Blattamonas nauphoetae TaxID=2049346 RepID=A0ABQ9WZ00_9EUKA|nr:hypothetical protein BLNAU_20321 [Blattamonas nauphoetae]
MNQTAKLMNGQLDSPLRFQSPEHRPSPLNVPGGLSPEQYVNVNGIKTPHHSNTNEFDENQCLLTPESLISLKRQSNKIRKSNASLKLPRVALLGEKWAQDKKNKMKAEGRELAKTPKTPYTPRTPNSIQSPTRHSAFATTPGVVQPTTPSGIVTKKRNTISKKEDGTQKMKAKRSPKPRTSPQKQQIKWTSATKVPVADKTITASQKHIERIRKSQTIQKENDVQTPTSRNKTIPRRSSAKNNFGSSDYFSGRAQVFSQSTTQFQPYYGEEVNAITPTEHEILPNSSDSTNTSDATFPSPPRDEGMMIDSQSVGDVHRSLNDNHQSSLSNIILQQSQEMESVRAAHEREIESLQKQVEVLEQTMHLQTIENEAIQSEVNGVRRRNEENMDTVKRGSELMMNELRKRNERLSMQMQSIPTKTTEEKDDILTNLFVSLCIMLKLQFALENRQTSISVTDLYNEIRPYPVQQWSERIVEALSRPKPFRMIVDEIQWM